MATTILYLTHPGLDQKIHSLCHRYLYEAAGDLPVIEMWQNPEWELSGLSMYKQIQAGLEKVETKWVAIAEHDCIYSSEHFQFIPPDDEYFWYNQNSWLLQYHNPNHPEMDGTFSYWPERRVQSQLICDVERLKEVTEVQIEVCSDPNWEKIRRNRPVGEPGTVGEKALRLTKGSQYASLHSRIKDHLIGYHARDFRTKIPNIDIRWGGNFTGPRRGRKKTMNLEPWGTMQDIMVK